MKAVGTHGRGGPEPLSSRMHRCRRFGLGMCFLYRLAKSTVADRFILKGALLLTAWRAPVARPTMDIDLAGKTNNRLEHIRSLAGEVCELPTEPDGIEFVVGPIRSLAYQGRRGVRGCAGPIQRHACEGENPDADRHRFWRRDRPSTNRDRVPGDAGVSAASAHGPFDGDLLTRAIRSTFRHRGTTIDATPVGLTEAFSADLARAVQWRAFVRRSRFESEPGFGRDRGASAALRLSATVGDSAGGRLRSQVEARRTVGVTVAPPSPAGTATVENRSDRSDPHRNGLAMCFGCHRPAGILKHTDTREVRADIRTWATITSSFRPESQKGAATHSGCGVAPRVIGVVAAGRLSPGHADRPKSG